MGRLGKIIERSVPFLDSPRDGALISELRLHTNVEILGRETWLRVRLENGAVGFVLADSVEIPAGTLLSAASSQIKEYQREEGSEEVFVGNAINYDADFEPALKKIEQAGKEAGVQIYVVSTLREPHKPVSDAVVAQASLSNHFVGHAIDFNLKHDGRLYGSEVLYDLVPSSPNGPLRDEELVPKPIIQFIETIRNTECLRWGGDFASPDPIHIDDGYNVAKIGAYYAKVAEYWGDGVLEQPA